MIFEEKQRLREAIRRGDRPPAVNIRPILDAWPLWQQAKSVCGFWPLPGEPVWQEPWPVSQSLALPRIDGRSLTVHWVATPAGLSPGRFGILEPPDSAPAAAGFDLILVPGLAFDSSGRRLGRGAGFYDRFLRETPGLRVGIHHDLVERVPTEAHDIPMDFVVTPAGVLDCRP